jgi:hypothetical protein
MLITSFAPAIGPGVGFADTAAAVPVVAACVPEVAAAVPVIAAADPVVATAAADPVTAAIEPLVNASVPVATASGEAAGVAPAVSFAASGDFEHEQIRTTQIAAKNAFIVIPVLRGSSEYLGVGSWVTY